MALLGIDCATKSGLALEPKGKPIKAHTFSPRAKRAFDLEAGAIDYEHNGKVFGEWRRHLLGILNVQMDEGDPVLGVAIEAPLRANITFKKPVVDTQAAFAGQALRFEEKGGTTMATTYRLYGMHSVVAELCADRNIPLLVCNQTAWRASFFRGERPPRGAPDPSKWWKQLARKYCQMLRIDVPNDDAAEAVGVLYWLKAQVEPRYAAADTLFGGKNGS